MSNLETNLPTTFRLLEEDRQKGLHPGAQIYVSLSSRVIADEGFGESRPGVSMNRDTINLWMSATKPITAILYAQIWEDHTIELDTPVSEIIPEFAAGNKAAITFRHILTHTGGFRSEPPGLDSSDCETVISRICEMTLEADWVLGEKAGYHTATSWYVLAEAVSRVTNRSFTELVRGQIFDPLSMDDSWIGLPQTSYFSYGDRIGWMFRTQRGSEPDESLNSKEAAAGIRPGGNGRGPIRELARFYEMLLAGGEGIIKPETVEQFTSRQREGLFDHTFQHIMDWGLGFIVDSNRYGAETVPYGFGRHASPSTFGHGGSQSSAAFADPYHDLVVALVCNGMPGEPRHNRRARDIHSAIYEDLGLGLETSKP